MFNGEWEESQAQKATFPDDDPKAFSMLLSWLYLDKIEIFTALNSSQRIVIDGNCYIDLFAIAEKYGIVALADNTMDYIINKFSAGSILYDPEQINRVYASTHATSKHRRFASRALAYLISSVKPDMARRTWTDDKLSALLAETPDLIADLIPLQRMQSGKVMADSRKAPLCDYHQHGKDETCPYKT